MKLTQSLAKQIFRLIGPRYCTMTVFTPSGEQLQLHNFQAKSCQMALLRPDIAQALAAIDKEGIGLIKLNYFSVNCETYESALVPEADGGAWRVIE